MELTTLLLSGFVLILTFLLWYTLRMSSQHGVFKKMGVVGPAPWPIVGNFLSEAREGLMPYDIKTYNKYKDHKVYGVYRTKHPILVLRDLDLIKEVCVKKFNSFVNRFVLVEKGDLPLDHMMTMLKDDHWKRVRTTTSPAFSTGKLRRMYSHIEKSTNTLLENLTEKQERNEPVELKDVFSHFTLDVISSTGFGYEINSCKDPENPFIVAGKTIMGGLGRAFFVYFFLDFLLPVLTFLGIGMFPSWACKFFISFVNKAKEDRRQELLSMGAGKTSKRGDFLQLMMEAETDARRGGGVRVDNDNMSKEEAEALGVAEGTGRVGTLTNEDIQGQAFIFILAGFDTVATALSFTTFLLATNPDCLRRVVEEIDEHLQGEFPNYDNVQKLTYLDMCLNESIRLYPPGFLLDRVCTEDVDIGGITVPKGMTVMFPVCAIHRDPEIWPDPERFDPERFTPEAKANRHPYAHNPFGQGPRNCIGMRLALLEMKVGLSALLQKMTPVTCDKTVCPIVLEPLRLQAQAGLWVKMEARR